MEQDFKTCIAKVGRSFAFSVVELVMTILLLGILSTIAISIVGTSSHAQRYESTRQKMEKIRSAILGEHTVQSEGYRQNFGFHGDWGSMPISLSALETAQTPVWIFDSFYVVGAGWKGPYISFFLSTGITKDAWGNDFIYSPAASPPTLISYGQDGVAGGTGYGKDLVMQFSSHLRLANVSGFVVDGTTRLSAKSVEIRYPVRGTLTAFSTSTDSNGFFSFSNVYLAKPGF